jgi:hypothetical protein
MTERVSLRFYRLWGFLAVLGALLTAGPGVSSPAQSERAATSSRQVEVLAKYGRLPLHFIANQGQIDRKVRFYARRGGSTFFFTREGLVLTLPETGDEGHSKAASRKASRTGPEQASRRKVTLRLTLLGLSPEVKVEAIEPLQGRVNYFVGKDPHKWHPDIPTYRAVVYREAYPGIDLKFYGNGRQLEYDIIVRPGADPSKVKFRCCGVQGLEVTPAGDLTLKLLGVGELVYKKPLIYQEIGGQRQVRTGRFQVQQARDGYVYGFTLAAYDPRHPLIIDPVLRYSTYLGGGATDYGNGIDVDQGGNIYITGETSSTDFPKAASYDDILGGTDTFVTKINSGGTDLVYSTYLGGSGWDTGMEIAVDGAGYAIVVGTTFSADFPMKYPIQDTNKGNGDVFVTKLNASGSDLVYSTFLGGTLGEYGQGIAMDRSGYAYVAGETWSEGFPVTENAYDKTLDGERDAFVCKIGMRYDRQLEHFVPYLVYSTFLGGSDIDSGSGIAVDGLGDAYVTGWTNSLDFPKNRPIPCLGQYEAFVTKFDPAGALVYSLCLGGSSADFGMSIAVDRYGCAYVTGETHSSNFPKKNYVGDLGGSSDAFVTKINIFGDVLMYSRYLGGSSYETGDAIAVDGADNAYVTGKTYSTDFPQQNPFQPNNKGNSDAFVTKVRPDGTLAYSSYLGGSNFEWSEGIAVDSKGRVCIAGYTNSSDFPPKRSLYPYNSGYDVFVVQLSGGVHVPLDLLLSGN